MPFSYDSNDHVYINLDTGEPVSWFTVDNILSNQRSVLNNRVELLAEALFNGEISNSEWRSGMRTAIKDAYVSNYLAGKGGRNNMIQSDWGRIGGLLSNQYRYLDNFIADILEGDLSEAQISARSKLYIASSKQAFERSKAVSRSLVLPAYPGDGTSECMANCKCSWVINEFSDHWEAVWQLSNAEHCNTCVERSNLWAPLYISK